MLDKAIDSDDSAPRAKKLKDACRIRWVERVDSYIVFLELLPSVHTALDAMVHPSMYHDLGTEWSWDGDTITKANGFLYQIQSSSFLICFNILT